MAWLIAGVYLVGFVLTFRRILPITLTEHQRREGSLYYDPVMMDAWPYVQAIFAGLFWPPFLLFLLLTAGIKSDQEIEQEQEESEAKQRKAQAEFKQKAKDMNIPGWEHL